MNQAPQYPVPQQPVGTVASSRLVTITLADLLPPSGGRAYSAGPQDPPAVARSRVVTITAADAVATAGFPIRALYGLGQPPILVRPSALFKMTADVPAFINLLPNLVQALVTT